MNLIVAAGFLFGGGLMGFGAFAASPTPLSASHESLSECERAGVEAELLNGLPAGLLIAIGRVESGRWDSTRGRATAWPWTINAAGKGTWFVSKDDATRTVEGLLAAGTRSIDVGCFQINLMWHPTAFSTLDQAFDPDANAHYAARFLLSLFSQTGSWESAVEAYHSADPALGFAYRQQVYSTWSTTAPTIEAVAAVVRFGPGPKRIAAMSPAIALPIIIAGVRIWTPSPVGTAGEVVAMPGTTQVVATTPATSSLPLVSYRVIPPGLIPHR